MAPAFPGGLKLLHDGVNSRIDIIFIHGLNGDRECSWTADGSSVSWPQSLLPPKIPDSRILTFGYDGYVTDWRGVVSQNRIANHAWNLLTAVANYRDGDGTSERPVMFVCHSSGGLICQDALVTSKHRPERHLRNMVRSTRAILFLGTPHHGAGLARWAELLAKSIGIIKQTNTELLRDLRQDSDALARIQDGFHTMVLDRNRAGGLPPIEIQCYYEELPLKGFGVVVARDSAVLPGYIPVGIHRNHTDMIKFADEDDAGFQAVVGELCRLARDAPNLPETSADHLRMQARLGVPPPCYHCRKEAIVRADTLRHKEYWDVDYYVYWCDGCGRRTYVGGYRSIMTM